ncbi:MAG: hypothetical protein FWG11_02605 [Promicromonosporaceae bacterium]|nr:hypothetical protein [Promicromonosporaceae bacterium]
MSEPGVVAHADCQRMANQLLEAKDRQITQLILAARTREASLGDQITDLQLVISHLSAELAAARVGSPSQANA